MAQAYHVRPSEMLHIKSSWAAYNVDAAVMAFGMEYDRTQRADAKAASKKPEYSSPPKSRIQVVEGPPPD